MPPDEPPGHGGALDALSPTALDIDTGLSAAQVAERVAQGATNDVPDRASRSVRDIVRANVFTRINAILAVLLAIVLATGSVIDGLFGLLIIANSGVGIIQEVRAKRTLDQLAIVSQAKPLIRRDGAAAALSPREVVLDDVIELGPGDQVVVDGEVVEAEGLEVDESLLTGEAGSRRQAGRERRPFRKLRRFGHGRLQGDQGGARRLRRQVGGRGEQVHAGSVGAALGNQPDPQVRHLSDGPRRVADHLQPVVRERGVAAAVPHRDGRRPRADGARRSRAADIGGVRRRRHPPGPAPVPRAGAAGDRGARSGRRRLCRQDRDAHRERDASRRDPSDRASRRGRSTMRAGGAGRRRPPSQCQRRGDQARPARPAGLGRADGSRAVLVGQEVERAVLRRQRQLAARRPRRAPRTSVGGGGTGRGDRQHGVTCAPPRQRRPSRRRSRSARHRDPARPRGARAAGPSRRQGHARVLRQSGRERQGDLRRQRRVRRRRRRIVGIARGRRPRRRPVTSRRSRGPGRDARALDHVRSGPSGSEAGYGRSAAVARPHGGDDRRRGQRRARPQGRRHRCGNGFGKPGDAGRSPDRAPRQPLRHAAARGRRGPAGDRQHRAGLQPVPHQDGVFRAPRPARRA